jgi:hypothetical protein
MVELVFEIWIDADEGGQMMMLVASQNDKVRRATMPGAACVHRYTAQSCFDAFRQNNAWNDWGPWDEGDLEDDLFTEEQAATQRAYLDEREPVAVLSEHTRPSIS